MGKYKMQELYVLFECIFIHFRFGIISSLFSSSLVLVGLAIV